MDEFGRGVCGTDRARRIVGCMQRGQPELPAAEAERAAANTQGGLLGVSKNGLSAQRQVLFSRLV